MIVNPICHWAGADPGPAPLLNFSPGAAGAEDLWGTGDQLPTDQPFYYSAAAMAAAGIVGVPSTILGFEEAQGNPIVDLVGANNLTPFGVGSHVPKQGLPTTGMRVNGSFDGSAKKAIELEHDAAYQHRLLAANNTIFDFGAATSFAMFTIFRLTAGPALSSIYSKRDSHNTTGFGLRISGATGIAFDVEDTVGNTFSSGYSAQWYPYGWHYAVVYLDRSTNQIQAVFDVGDGAIGSAAAIGSITSAQTFTFGYSAVYSLPPPLQVAYHAVWIGAQAEAFRGSLAANRALLWTQDLIPTNCPLDSPAKCGPDTGQLISIINEDPTDGTQLTSAYGDVTNKSFLWEYNAKLSRANKLGVPMQVLTQNQCTYSNRLDGAFWNNNNIAVSSDFENAREIDPGGTVQADRIQSQASPAYLFSDDMTCVAGDVWSMGVFVIRNRRLEDVDVPACRLIAWDDNNNAEITSVTFDATDKWQWIRLDNFTIPAGCVDVQFWLELPWGPVISHPIIGNSADRYINAVLCTAVRDLEQSHPIYRDSTFAGYAENIISKYTSAGGAYCKGAQGEIELVFAGYGNWIGAANRILLDCTTGVAFNGNRRQIGIDAAGIVWFQVWNSLGVYVGYAPAPSAIADLNTEHTIVARWNIAGLPSGNKMEISIDGGAYGGINPAAWTVSDSVSTHYFGNHNDGLQSLNGTLSSIRIWDAPR